MTDYNCTAVANRFLILSKKRLHQRECEAANPYLEISETDADAITKRTVAELLTCDICGAKNDGAEEIQHDTTTAGFAIELTSECTFCGTQNDNGAILI